MYGGIFHEHAVAKCPGRCLSLVLLHQAFSGGFHFPGAPLDLDEHSWIFESARLSAQWKDSEMDLRVSNQSLGHPSPHCKTTVCKLPQLSKLLGREGDREGNWKRLGAPLAFRQGCPPGSEVTATAGRRPYGCHVGRARQMGKSSPLPLLSAEKQKSKTGRKNQAPFHSAAGAGWNRRADPLSGCFWDNSLADAPGFSSLRGSPRRIYCWAINEFLNRQGVM